MYILEKIGKSIGIIILALLLLISLPYYNSIFYTFQPLTPFQGDYFYNPYESCNGKWIKANFHAHSKLLNGLTNGDNVKEEMFAKYDSLNYDLPCLSNYNSITENHKRDLYTNVYEHGLNIGFTHHLVINAKEATLFDYPLFQLTSHKQYNINRLKKASNLIALAHPNFKTGYDLDELKILRNYDLMEVISPRSNSVKHWDEALSSGKLVWALGNDDSHDTSNNHCGIAWTMINTPSNNNDTIIQNIKKGKCYATKGWLAQEMIYLKKVEVKNNLYTIELEEPADSIILKSDLGRTIASISNSNYLDYQIKPENTYIRAEIFETEPWNRYTKVYLNPVIRTKDGTIKNNIEKMEVNWLKTICFLLLLVIGDIVIVKIIIKLVRKL